MTSRASRSLLVAALAFLALPSYGTAQAPRRPAQADSPYRAATRAFNEGRYDEVDAIPDKADPNIIAVKGRAAIARGRYAEAESQLRAVASRFPSSEAALELGLLQQMLGRPDAVALLEKVAPLADASNDPVEVARAGRALRALGRFHESNAAYRDAAGAAPNDPAIQTAFGDLFLEKYDNAEALKSYQMALQVDPRWTAALIGSARVLADENPPQAAALATRALEVNPSSVDAEVFLAGEAADVNKYDEARQALDKALVVNPSSLEAISLRAALSYVQDKPQEFEAEAAKALAIAPRYGEVYRVAGDLAARNYRFDEAVELARRSLALDGSNAHAEADLGSHLLRAGDEAGARTALEASFKADPFNKLVYNQLTVMDKVDKFVTIRDGDVVMRLDKDEAPV
ncbi:MAG: tetratricopeptide repeat protein, partial [Vicinamibacterales bacterium]